MVTLNGEEANNSTAPINKLKSSNNPIKNVIKYSLTNLNQLFID